MTERINPYTRLKRECLEWASKAASPRTRGMLHFPGDRVDGGGAWRLDDLKQRVIAARQLGWRVELSVDDDGDLVVRYVEQVPPLPWGLQS